MSNLNMPDLPGDLRELVLYAVQDIRNRLDWIEERLCLSEDEEGSEDEEENEND